MTEENSPAYQSQGRWQKTCFCKLPLRDPCGLWTKRSSRQPSPYSSRISELQVEIHGGASVKTEGCKLKVIKTACVVPNSKGAVIFTCLVSVKIGCMLLIWAAANSTELRSILPQHCHSSSHSPEVCSHLGNHRRLRVSLTGRCFMIFCKPPFPGSWPSLYLPGASFSSITFPWEPLSSSSSSSSLGTGGSLRLQARSSPSLPSRTLFPWDKTRTERVLFRLWQQGADRQFT